MSERAPSGSGRDSDLPSEPRAEIVDLRCEIAGAFATLECGACSQRFEGYQLTVGGIPFCEHVCTGCGAKLRIMPEDFIRALDRHLPACSTDEITALMNAATDVAETWYRSDGIAPLLAYRGLDLGPPTERELMSFVSSGIYRSHTRGQRKP